MEERSERRRDRPADRRRRPRGGRLEDGRVVRVQQPGAAVGGDRGPDPRGRRRARLPAEPGRPDAHPAPDDDARRADAPGPRGDLLEPVLRAVQRGRRPRRRGRSGTSCTSSRRSTARWHWPSAARRSTASWPSACRADHPEVEPDPRRRPADGRSSTRTTCPSTARSSSTTRPGHAPRREHLLDLGHRDVLVLGGRGPERPLGEGAAAHGVTGERRGCAAIARRLTPPGSTSPTSASLSGRASIEGGAVSLPARLGRWASGRRPSSR